MKGNRLKLPFEWQIGLRYARGGRRSAGDGFVSFIAGAAMAGIALGVAALIVVLSVMNGFRTEVRDRMLSVLAHVEIFSPTGSMPDWRLTAHESLRNPAVRAVAPYVDAQALLTNAGSVTGVALRGIDPVLEPRVSEIARKLKTGRLDALVPGEMGIVLGAALADALHVKIGDRITFFAPGHGARIGEALPRFRQFNVVGTFESGHYQYDSALAYIHIHDARKLFNVPAPTGVRLRVDDLQRAPEIALALSRTLSGDLYIRDWTRQNRTWFEAERLQKRMLSLILMLIVAVAAFNLVSSLVMTVTQKQGDIAILRTLGAPPRSIMKIFAIQGMTIGLAGTLAGVASGCAIAVSIPWVLPAIEQVLGIRFLTPSVYFLSSLPSKLSAIDVIEIAAAAFLMSCAATLYPSWRAARVRPAEALRDE
ncbi:MULTISPECIES: lipoprotein-releasing ABC transporter permease subunit [Burkholderia]|uniref:lipoprotein-releasing ABC transporter permease subunit n=1 Tax=Burkholderia TaxID=32008 RepID=UPI000F5AC368|nr:MULTISPECIES: lipoprotein-releasing ABC transporter permease subunit [Burkholderia]MBN3739329.1 lipoprotein-releasing ABC transporter permease subunit [Burkholderia sp. Tr-20355]MCA8425465.1 lipoprotein-releasing ABC transporter permease subunit [Burkholderia seminalis]RQS80929.1 lipoprotein-releasing ABC transporter permease subunit [Burkholderia seminalis]